MRRTANVVTVLRVDVSVEDLPWRTLNRVEVAIAETLRIDKLPTPSMTQSGDVEVRDRAIRRLWQH